MSENTRLAAALRLLPVWTLGADERLAGHDESDLLAVLADEIETIFPTGEPDDLGQGVATLLYLVDAALSRAAEVAGMTRAELAVDIAQRIAKQNFGIDA